MRDPNINLLSALDGASVRSAVREHDKLRLALCESIGKALSTMPEPNKRFVDIARAVDLRSIVEKMERADADFGENLRILARHGWFISVWHTPFAGIPPLVALFKRDRTAEAHKRLCAHFNGLLDDIEADLSKKFPAREVILRKAFKAHRKDDFELSIPVFLAQADGIARETIGKSTRNFSIYSKKNSSCQTLQAFIEAVATERMEREILEIALVLMPLNASEGDPLLLGEVLNRHEILHGVNTTYAKPLNSCRAISWLQYVAHFFEAKEKANRRKRT